MRMTLGWRTSQMTPLAASCECKTFTSKLSAFLTRKDSWQPRCSGSRGVMMVTLEFVLRYVSIRYSKYPRRKISALIFGKVNIFRIIVFVALDCEKS